MHALKKVTVKISGILQRSGRFTTILEQVRLPGAGRGTQEHVPGNFVPWG